MVYLMVNVILVIIGGHFLGGIQAATGQEAVATSSSTATRIHISQTAVRPPDIIAFLDVLDIEGNPVDMELGATNLTVKLDTHSIPVNKAVPISESDEPAAYIFLVDVSASLAPDQFSRIKEAMNTWVDGIGEADQVAVISFGEDVQIVERFSNDKEALKETINGLQATDQLTHLYDGVSKAIEFGRAADITVPRRRLIITLTDGYDESAGKTEAEIRSQITDGAIPIYAIGFNNSSAPRDALRSFGELARLSGGDIDLSDTGEFSGKYESLYNRIQQSYIVTLDCALCVQASGGEKELRIELNRNSVPLSAQYTVQGVHLTLQEIPSGISWWMYLVAAIILGGILAGGAYSLRKRKEVEPEPLPEIEEEKDEPIEDNDEVLPPPPPVHAQIKLTVVGGQNSGEIYQMPLRNVLFIGRGHGENMLHIPIDNNISSQHCALLWQEGHIMIEDTGSTNGTLVDGVPIKSRYALQGGERILLGQTEFRIAILEPK